MFFIFAFFFFFILMALAFFLKPQKKSLETLWFDFSDSLFEQFGVEGNIQNRVQDILASGAKRLGLRFGIVCAHGERELNIVASYAAGYSSLPFSVGAFVPKEKIFCSKLGEHRRNIAIDFVSLSAWRGHSCYREFGIETYIGTYLPELGLSVAFFDTIPRDHLFTKVELDFIKQLGSWVGAILDGTQLNLPLSSGRAEIFSEETRSGLAGPDAH